LAAAWHEARRHRAVTEKYFTPVRGSRTLRAAIPPMIWYYAKEGAAAGPISDEDMLSRLRHGDILPSTLIWRAGMAEWRPASSIFADMPAPGEKEPVPSAAEPVAGVPPVLPFYFCTWCGTVTPADQLVHIDGRAMCASCKPEFLQAAQEGVVLPFRAPLLDPATASRLAPSPATMPFAGFWIRALASIVDVLILSGITLGISMATGQGFEEAMGLDGSEWTRRDTITFAVENLFGTIYEALMVARFGGTLGKLICRIRVVTAQGARLSYGHAFLRALAQWVSLLPCGMGYVLVAFDREKRALHDFICNTRVIWK
jgi:uncharacterized RDD family membrane protein YckC